MRWFHLHIRSGVHSFHPESECFQWRKTFLIRPGQFSLSRKPTKLECLLRLTNWLCAQIHQRRNIRNCCRYETPFPFEFFSFSGKINSYPTKLIFSSSDLPPSAENLMCYEMLIADCLTISGWKHYRRFRWRYWRTRIRTARRLTLIVDGAPTKTRSFVVPAALKSLMVCRFTL